MINLEFDSWNKIVSIKENTLKEEIKHNPEISSLAIKWLVNHPEGIRENISDIGKLLRCLPSNLETDPSLIKIIALIKENEQFLNQEFLVENCILSGNPVLTSLLIDNDFPINDYAHAWALALKNGNKILADQILKSKSKDEKSQFFFKNLEEAKALASKDGGKISRTIKNYGFNPKTEEGRAALLEVARITAAGNGVVISQKLREYGFDAHTSEGRVALLEIAKIAIAQNPAVLRQIRHYEFDSQTQEGKEAFFEIAKTAARYSGSDITQVLGKPGFIFDVEELLEIALINAAHSPHGVSEWIKGYGFDPKTQEGREALLTIAKASAHKNGLSTTTWIREYGFDPKTKEGYAALLEIAKIAMDQSKGLSSSLIANYGFDPKTEEGKAALLEIATLLATHYPRTICQNIQNFGFNSMEEEGRTSLLKIAKICATSSSHAISELIKNYRFDPKTLEGRKALLEVAKTAAARFGSPTSKYLKNYEFDPKTEEGRADLLAIAKIAILQSSAAASEWIRQYGFDPKSKEGASALEELAKFSAAINGENTSQFIKAYQFDPKTEEGSALLHEVAYISAQQDSLGTFVHLDNYGFDYKVKESRRFALKIAKNVNIQDPKLFSIWFSKVGSAFPFSDEEEREDFLSVLKKILNKEGAQAATPDLIKGLSTQIPHELREKLIFSLTLLENSNNFENFEKTFSTRLNSFRVVDQLNAEIDHAFDQFQLKKQKQWEVENREFDLEEALKEFANRLPMDLIGYLYFLMICSETNLDQRIGKWKEQLSETLQIQDPKLRRNVWNTLLSYIEANPEAQVQSLEETLFDCVCEGKFNESQDKPIFPSISKRSLKNAEYKKSLLKVLVELKREDTTPEGIQNFLNYVFSDDKINDQTIIQRLKKISVITSFERGNQLAYCENEEDINQTLEVCIKLCLPTAVEEVSNFAERFSDTFLSSRDPDAIFVYAASLRKFSISNKYTDLLQIFFKSILNGNFKEVRESSENNLHLQKLKNLHPELTQTWFKGCEEKQWHIDEGIQKEPFPIKEIFLQLLDPLHVEVDSLVLDVLADKKDRSEALKEIITKIQSSSKKEKKELQVSRDILRFLDPSLSVSGQNSRLKAICKALKNRDLANNLEQLLIQKPKVSEVYYVCDSDDPFDIFLNGNEVNSCMKLHGDSKYNSGVLGSLLNGHNRLLTLKTNPGSQNPVTARALTRLLLDEKGVAVMLIEPIYPKTCSQLERKILIDFAIERSKDLGVPLVSRYEGQKRKIYPLTVVGYGGVGPEYVDSLGPVGNKALWGGFKLARVDTFYV